MVQRVSLNQMEAFSRRFEDGFRAIRVRVQTLMMARGILPPAYDVWTDNVKSPEFVAVLANDTCHRLHQPVGHIFARSPANNRNKESFLRFLDSVQFHWDRNLQLDQLNYPDPFSDVAEFYAPRVGKFGPDDLPSNQLYLPTNDPDSIDITEKISSGFHLDSLKAKDVDFVNNTWKYNLGDATAERIAFWIKYLPTSCIRTSNGDCVAHSMCTDWASIGMVYTDPTHRREKFASVVVKDCSRKMLKLGLGCPVYCQVVKVNKPSYNLFTQLGWKDAYADVIFAVNVMDKNSPSARLIKDL